MKKIYKIMVGDKEWEETDSYSEACAMAEYKSRWHDDVDIITVKVDE